VTLPLLTPALAGAMLLVFMSSLGSYSAPYVFGGGLRVLSTQIVASRLNGDEGIAFVETTVLAVSAVAAVLLLRWLEGRGPRVANLGKGVRAARRPVARGAARVLVAGAALVAVTFLVLPHLALVLVAFAKNGTWTNELLPPVYTLDNWRHVTSSPEVVRPIRNSVAMALVATGGERAGVRARRLPRRAAPLPGAAAAAPCCSRSRGPCRPPPSRSGSRRRSTATSRWRCAGCSSGRGPSCRSRTSSAACRSWPTRSRARCGRWTRRSRRRRAGSARAGRGACGACAAGGAARGSWPGATLALITGVGEFVRSVVLYTHRNRPDLGRDPRRAAGVVVRRRGSVQRAAHRDRARGDARRAAPRRGAADACRTAGHDHRVTHHSAPG
jgi:iron(III) transport system permease protein